MTLPLSQSQVLEWLALLHEVPAGKPTMLLGRLQHFKRLGFPHGVNTGRGYNAQYGVSQLVELMLAFELLRAGQRPEVVVRILDFPAHELAVNAKVIGAKMQDFPFYGKIRQRYMYFGDPLGVDGEVQPIQALPLAAAGNPQFQWEEELDVSEWTNVTIICLTNLFSKGSRALTAATGVTYRDFLLELIAWGDRTSKSDAA